MKWREGLRDGSFRGVHFITERSGFEGGRRVVEHQYPQRDVPYLEDLGRRTRRFSITALIIGKNYMETRDRLQQALEAKGPGTLVHHYLGSIKVVVENFSINEQTADGRMASFDITFVEAGTNQFPGGKPHTQSKVEACAEESRCRSEETFDDGPGTSYDIGGKPNAVADAAVRVILLLLGDLTSRADRLVGEGSPLTDFIDQVDATIKSAADLALDPTALATRTLALIAAFAGLPKAGLVTTPAGPVLPVLAFTRFGAELAVAIGPSVVARAIATNQTAYQNLVRRGAIIEAAAISARLDFESHNDAIAVRDRLGTQVRLADGALFATTAPATLDTDGTATAPARALLPGLDGNIEEGRALSLAAPVESVDSAVTAGVGGLTGGADEEEDESLRRRLLDRIQMPPAGGSAFDYERWALEVPGVTRAWVSPREMGEGSVTVRFMMDDTYPDGIPQEADEQAVFDHIYPLRPVTAELFVKAPVAVPLPFRIQGLEPANLAVRTAVEDELKDLIRREAVPDTNVPLLISHVREAISIAAGEFDHRLLDPTADVAHGVGEIATFGGVVWS